MRGEPSPDKPFASDDEAIAEPRRVGIDRGMIVPPDFFDPLPEEMLREFEGEAALPSDEPAAREENEHGDSSR